MQKLIAMILVLGALAFSQQAGQVPPDFKLNNLEGQPISLAQLKGEPSVVTFWASWCTVCKAELPKLHAVAQEMKLRCFVISREPRDSPQVVQSYMQKYPAFTPLVASSSDAPAQVANRWRIIGQPWTFVLDKEGKVVAFYAGAVDMVSFRSSLSKAGVQ